MKAPKIPKRSRKKSCFLTFVSALLLFCLGGSLLLFISNRNLPTRSASAEQLSQVEKARVEEAFHLRQSLGGRIWAGWDQADIPIIVYNERYAFLIGYTGQPPEGWLKVPQKKERGSAWEVVPDNESLGMPYYRQALLDPEITPEAFTVIVGDRWAASMQTWEYSEIAFYSGFRQDLPEWAQPLFPYQLVWSFLFGATETYISGLEHEAFHAFQGLRAPDRLAQAEYAAPLEDQYPWDNQESETAWEEELNLLVQAVEAETDAQAAVFAQNFLDQRSARRESVQMGSILVDYERQREWLEGLAKYSELALTRSVVDAGAYTPLAELSDDPTFNNYSDRLRFYDQQIKEIGRMTGHQAEIRFYYSGMAQAVLLDRFNPEWKERIFEDGVFLEDLLAEALLKFEG